MGSSDVDSCSWTGVMLVLSSDHDVTILWKLLEHLLIEVLLVDFQQPC